MGLFLGHADNLTDTEIKEQAARAGYSEVETGPMERLAFVKNNHRLVIYDDNTILG